MKKNYLNLCLLLFLSVTCAMGQGLSFELTGLDESWYVSNVFVASVPSTPELSFVSVNLLSADYLGEEDVRLLSMSTVGYEVTNRITSYNVCYTKLLRNKIDQVVM